MAIDTAQKRHGALTNHLRRGKIPNGTSTQADRQDILLTYPGILAQTPTLHSGGFIFKSWWFYD